MLWALLITYGVGMLYTIAHALNEPFGLDLQDVKLNQRCAAISKNVLQLYTSVKLDREQVIIPKHDTPEWIEEPFVQNAEKANQSCHSLGLFCMKPMNLDVFIGLLAFIVWSSFLIFLTWGITKGERRDTGVRWWSVYIPLTTGTTGYISLGIFLLLGFWISDAYNRYRRGLYLWQTTIRSKIEDVAFMFMLECRRGLWHERDRERVISHLVALPYVCKLALRDSRDMSQLYGILSRTDCQAFLEAPDFLTHGFNVLYGYFNSVDSNHAPTMAPSSKSPFGFSIYPLQYNMWALESALWECMAIREFQISPSFTHHLQIFTIFWLATLPLTIIIHDGFMSYIYLIPIAYSIIKLLSLGREIADPFGEDPTDIPVDMLCDEIRDSVHRMYHDTLDGIGKYIRKSDYVRDSFSPKMTSHMYTEGKPGTDDSSESDETATIKGSLIKVFYSLPSVSIVAQIAVTLWTVVAVLLSWRLSKLWDGDRQGACREWCSPVDVDGSVLANVGFALFMILSFRASDAIGRYEEGALLIFDMETNLRILALEFVQALPASDVFHDGDKERFVAHLVQIPLCFRDMLLDIRRDTEESKDGLLSPEDRQLFENSSSPIAHLIETLQAYILIQDVSFRHTILQKPLQIKTFIAGSALKRTSLIRSAISQALGVKRFPVIASYTSHQHIFTAIWLILLPLSMTAQTGFLTILWAPLIAYGVFGLESIAEMLVDPYGHDFTDIPVHQMCSRAACTVLDAVNSVQWSTNALIQPSHIDSEPGLGVAIVGRNVVPQYTLPHFEDGDALSDGSGKMGELEFNVPHRGKMKPSLYAHFLRSVPWWSLIAVFVWTTVATFITYISRDRVQSEQPRWWISRISISTNVAVYISFATFTLLGFYVQAAFARYNDAGAVWGDNLRASCHYMTTAFLSLLPENAIHEKDHDRIIGHIAAIPLLLKMQLRGKRDVREIKGLLSYSDIARLQCSESMVDYCVDVIRSYVLDVNINYKKYLGESAIAPGPRISFIAKEIRALENAIRSSQYLQSFEIAPGFLILLNALLGLWFLILPFVLVEGSGWFTILWVPIIAYGLLGVYTIANEIQNPFGLDLNDLDLDRIGNAIVSDILFTRKHEKKGWKSLIKETSIPHIWNNVTSSKLDRPSRSLFYLHDNLSLWQRFKKRIYLAVSAIEWWIMVAVIAWSSIAVTSAYLVSKYLPQNGAKNCEPWFCSAIAVENSVKEFVGFALFLLLGFRLYDSHGRFRQAVELWQDGLIGTLRLLTNRIFESYGGGTWHEGDLERICGHLAAFSICLMGSLRKKDYKDRLLEVLGEEDVERVLADPERVDYCLDVVRAYLIDGEVLDISPCSNNPCGCNEHWALFYYLRMLENSALECQRMIRIPLPYGYVHHLRIFLMIWIALLPFGLVEETGWLTILWIALIAYGVIGVERWAQQLSDPFGTDICDVPLEGLCERAVGVVRVNLGLFHSCMESLVYPNRAAFPGSKDFKSDESGLEEP